MAALRKRYNASLPKKYKPIVNAGIKKMLPILTRKSPNEFSLYSWGMIPEDSHDAQIGEKLLNARVETIKAKQPFCNILQNRCIIPADGFYVWDQGDENSTPSRAVLSSRETFSILGLYTEWGEDDENFNSIVKSFSMITTEAGESLAGYNERTPLIIPRSMEQQWLIGANFDSMISKAIEYTKQRGFQIYQVSEHINNEKNNQIKLIQNEDHTLPGQTLSLF